MTGPVVYRSRTPEVLQAWNTACDALSGYIHQTQAVLDAAGLTGYPVYRSTHAWGYGTARGIAVPAGKDPPKGWRMTSRYAVPDKRTKTGRHVAAQLDAIRHPGAPVEHLPGMPADVLHGGGDHRVFGPDVRVLRTDAGEAVYAEWRDDPEEFETSLTSGSTKVDQALWERIKLSEYYAAREAADGDTPYVKAASPR